MAKKPALAAERWGEILWVAYYALERIGKLNKLDPSLIWDFYYGSGGKKFTGFLKDQGVYSYMSELDDVNEFDTLLDSKKIKDKLDRLDWHGATKSQVQNFAKNPKTSFTKSLKVTRQGEFYTKKTNIQDFLSKVKSVFGYGFELDRWNPADVWFYSDYAVTQINLLIKNFSINDPSIFNKLPKKLQKLQSLQEVKALNNLFLELYNTKKLVPVSLKKASTISKGSYTSRIALINIPKDKNNKPRDPVITDKQYPIRKSDAVMGSRNLKYDIRAQDATLDKDGNILFRNKYDYIQTNEKGTSFEMPGSAGFRAAQGGSFNTNDAENVIYTAKGKRSMDEIRKKTDIKKFRNSQLLSKGMTLRLGIDPTDYSLHKKYLDELSNALEPYVKNQEKTIDKGVGKDTDKLRSLISKLEIATVIKESGQEDEIILDLYNAIKSKSVVNRKDFEKIIGKLSDSIYKQSRAKGQKQLTRQESDVLAKARLITKMGSNYKLPSSFYIKLY